MIPAYDFLVKNILHRSDLGSLLITYLVISLLQWQSSLKIFWFNISQMKKLHWEISPDAWTVENPAKIVPVATESWSVDR